ncbi:MAG: hypothetical protein BMS9Abin29_1534 [Gemmatimonadota bacterium]|nr:MAG: hypothetical protein BMS9Abin29_1534 [Gemmatimonadota bacterium]
MSKRHHPGARRIPHSHEEEEDAFLAKILAISTWARSNTEALVLAGVILALFVAGGFYYWNFTQERDQTALTQLEVIHNTINLDAKDDAKALLRTFLDQFGASPHAREGVLLLARLNLETNAAPVAVSILEDEGLSLRTPLGLQAGFLLARAYEETGRWSDAEAMYLRIADRATLDYQVREALDSAAQARMRQMDPAGAVELYERLLATFEDDDPGRGVFEMRLAEVREIVSD